MPFPPTVYTGYYLFQSECKKKRSVADSGQLHLHPRKPPEPAAIACFRPGTVNDG
jgi:hypothetical protein